jgi:hypothetical protein
MSGRASMPLLARLLPTVVNGYRFNLFRLDAKV